MSVWEEEPLDIISDATIYMSHNPKGIAVVFKNGDIKYFKKTAARQGKNVSLNMGGKLPKKVKWPKEPNDWDGPMIGISGSCSSGGTISVGF